MASLEGSDQLGTAIVWSKLDNTCNNAKRITPHADCTPGCGTGTVAPGSHATCRASTTHLHFEDVDLEAIAVLQALRAQAAQQQARAEGRRPHPLQPRYPPL